MNQAQRALEVRLTFPVQTYDIDFAGIVSNIVYIRWLEDLRLRILAEHYPLARLYDEGLFPILLRTEIDYQNPIHIHDSVEGRMWVADLSRVRCYLEAEFLIGEQMAAKARQMTAFVDQERLRPVRIPADLRNKADLD